jgi:endonuclease I
MKKQLFFTLLLLSFLSYAQIPAYYNDVNLNLDGISLKNELATKVINTHVNYLSYSEIWYASRITDLDPNDSSNQNVLLVYGYNDNDGNYRTDRTRSKYANGGNNGTDWNREHVYAKSLGTPNLGTSGPGSDAHHLRPCDATWNSTRSSKKFAPGSGTSGSVSGGWYPGDEWKGDVARMMMYMYIRYGNQCKPTNVGVGSANATPDYMIDLFLQWNAEDPVSQIEINRNNYHGNSANTYAQGNRNPFIDNPAFATQIWGGPQAEDLFGSGNTTDTQAPSTPNNLTASNVTQNTVNLNWNASTDNVGISNYDIYVDGNYLNSTTQTNYLVTSLTANTNYSFYIEANDASGNTSNASNTVNVLTLPSGNGGNNSNELFFSEYVEGSSYNKALEIANITGNTVDLSAYTIKKQSNGNGSWTSGYTLNGQLSDGSVFVIANSNASSVILNTADDTTTATELSFNGNDPVGLFKNSVLIDVIGNFNGGSSYFAKDKTLQRNTNISSSNTIFDLTEWTEMPKNTFDDLGNFSFNEGNNNTTTDVLIETSFESGLDNWIDGGGDCYRINSPSRSSDGNYSVRIRDNSGTASSLTSSFINLSGYNAIQIHFDYYSYSMESNEDFWVRFYNGSYWETVQALYSGSDFYNNEFTSAVITINANDYNFSSSSKIRFQCDASSNYDQIYIDNVKIVATNGVFNKLEPPIIKKEIYESKNDFDIEIERTEIFPNPVSNQKMITLQTVFDIEDKNIDIRLIITNIQGKVIYNKEFKLVEKEFFEQKIDVSNLKKGIYFLSISSTNNTFETKKLIIY